MLRRTLILLLAWLISIAALAQFAGGQVPTVDRQQTLAGDITLRGVVVNSVTGEPISRALVQMTGMSGRSVLTDSEGKFQFEGLPEMQVALMPRKPGYFSDAELQRGVRTRPLQVTSGMGSVTVKLIPAGVITGHINTVDGEPLEGARIRLKMRSIQNGRKQWTERGGAATDEDGAFRIGNLAPGTYYLFTDGAVRMSMYTAADETFAPAYYPGAADISGAAPIEVRAGQTAVIDLTLRKEKAYRVTGVITGLQPGQGANVEVLGAGGEHLPIQAMVSPGTSTFEVRRIPQGTYLLKVFAQQRPTPEMMNRFGGFAGGIGSVGRGPRMPQMYSGSAPLIVAGDVSGVTVAVQPTANIPVNVRTEFNNPQADAGVSGKRGRPVGQYANLRLVRTDGQPGDNFAQVDENQNLTIRNVEPGRYRVEFMQMGGDTYVRSATYGNTDLLHDELVVANGGDSQPIEIVVRDDAASLSGTANCDNVQCWVLIAPDSSSAVQPRMVFVNPQGVFQSAGLAPGSYHVYAFDRNDGIEFANPDAMKGYGAHAETVVLSAGQKAQVNVSLTKVTDQ